MYFNKADTQSHLRNVEILISVSPGYGVTNVWFWNPIVTHIITLPLQMDSLWGRISSVMTPSARPTSMLICILILQSKVGQTRGSRFLIWGWRMCLECSDECLFAVERNTRGTSVGGKQWQWARMPEVPRRPMMQWVRTSEVPRKLVM